MNWPRRLGPNAGSLLIAAGLLLSLTAAASGLADARRGASPPDPFDGVAPQGVGFDPLVVAEAGSGHAEAAPTLPVQQSGLYRHTPTAVTSAAATHSAAATAAPSELGQAGPADKVPAASATPVPVYVPDRLVIPAIELDALIVPAEIVKVMSMGEWYHQWLAPERKAAGWHITSAPLGVAGNTVLNGHHNVRGEVFGHLADLREGDLIWAYSGDRVFAYRIVVTDILPERWQTLEVRLKNAQWIAPSGDERLTLITCWPYASNTHRLVIVAVPVSPDAGQELAVIPRKTPHPALP